MMKFKIGDLVELNDGRVFILTNNEDINSLEITLKTLREAKVTKLSRTYYKTVTEEEEDEELLTDKEKQFLKSYIQILEGLNNGKVVGMYRSEDAITFKLATGLMYKVELGKSFGNFEVSKSYNIDELGLEEPMKRKKSVDEQVWDRVYPLTNKGDYGMMPPCIEAQEAFNELARFFMGDDYYVVGPMNNTQANTQILYDIERKFWKYRANKKRGRK